MYAHATLQTNTCTSAGAPRVVELKFRVPSQTKVEMCLVAERQTTALPIKARFFCLSLYECLIYPRHVTF